MPRKPTHIRFHSCTISRIVVRSYGTLNIITGKVGPMVRGEPETGPCNVPLFGDDTASGVCRSCRSGWEHPDNRFASEAEKRRAVGSL
jgi:hypothetical protein